MTKAIICSGYFNPLHIGHLELLENAKKAGDLLIVIVNNDLQRKLKGSKEFQTEDERLAIVRAIRYVDIAYVSIDEDATQIETLKMLKQRCKSLFTITISKSPAFLAFSNNSK